MKFIFAIAAIAVIASIAKAMKPKQAPLNEGDALNGRGSKAPSTRHIAREAAERNLKEGERLLSEAHKNAGGGRWGWSYNTKPDTGSGEHANMKRKFPDIFGDEGS